MMIPPDIPGFPGVYQLMALKSYRRGEKGGGATDGKGFRDGVKRLMEEILHHLGWLKPYK